jgi:hypothetical protein
VVLAGAAHAAARVHFASGRRTGVVRHLTGRSRNVRYRAIRDHSFAAMVGHYRSESCDNESKGDKYPPSGVNLRCVFGVARLVQVCH